VAVSALVVALALQPAADCRAASTAVASVRAVADGIVAADNERNIERVMGYYADDAWLMPPNAEPVRGHAAIRPRYESLFAGFNPAIEGRIDEACVSGSTAYVRGHNGGRMNSRSGGPARELDDSYLMLLKIDTAGRWRISHLIWHAAH
jgi:ketosteroid isomerase-like protein